MKRWYVVSKPWLRTRRLLAATAAHAARRFLDDLEPSARTHVPSAVWSAIRLDALSLADATELEVVVEATGEVVDRELLRAQGSDPSVGRATQSSR